MLQFLLRISSGIDRFSGFIGAFIATLTMLMILIGAWNVVGRFVGRAVGENLTSNTLLELQWYLFAVIFLLGGAYVLRVNEHVRVDVIYDRLAPRRRAVINMLGHVLFLIPFCFIVLDVTLNWFAFSYDIREGSPDPGGLPRWPIKFMVIVAFVMLLVQTVSEIIKTAAILRGHLTEEERDEIARLRAEVLAAEARDAKARDEEK